MEFFAQTCRDFTKITGDKLKSVDSLYPPDLGGKALDLLIERHGAYAPHAASFLMRLMYGRRVAARGSEVYRSPIWVPSFKWSRFKYKSTNACLLTCLVGCGRTLNFAKKQGGIK